MCTLARRRPHKWSFQLDDRHQDEEGYQTQPERASIILSVEDVKGWLSENGSGGDQDLTAKEVGELFDRSPATIRAWIRAGRLDAYLFRGNEYRITHAALEEFQGQERSGGQ